MADKQPSSRLRTLIVFLMGLYIFGLLVYLALRLLRVDAWWLALLHNGAPYLFAPVVILLPLALLLRMPRLTGWLVVLGVIAALWFAPLFLPKTLPALPEKYLTVITFNVYPDNPRLSEVERWLLLKNADVVLLQETNGQTMLDSMPALQERYPYRIAQDFRNGDIFLSRYPILESGEFMLTDTAHQRIIIDYNGQSLTLYNIHLYMPVGETPHLNLPLIPGILLAYDETLRNNQIDELLALVSQTEAPYLVAGDFNMSEFSFVYEKLAAAMDDVYRETGTGFGVTYPAGASEEFDDGLPMLFRLDYAWHSAGIRPLYSEIGPRLGSDHLPLFMALEITQ